MLNEMLKLLKYKKALIENNTSNYPCLKGLAFQTTINIYMS